MLTHLLPGALLLLAAPLIVGIVWAQTLPPVPTYGYEVASIHRSVPGQTNTRIAPGPRGGLKTTNTTVVDLLGFAYAAKDYQFINAPTWASSERYDVTFTPDAPETPLEQSSATALWEAARARNEQRLRAVLRDRCGIVVRQEARELPIYALIQAKGGAKLVGHAEGGLPSGLHSIGRGQMTGVDTPIKMLIDNFLSFYLGRPIIDETGLMGSYDFKLQWNPEQDQLTASPQPELNPSTGPSILTALTEQLGLRLQSGKGPVVVYVIEKMERPSEN